MKFVGREGDSLEFDLSLRETDALTFVLRRYPSLDAAYHKITRPGTPSLADEQPILVESMSEMQAENQRLLAKFLASKLHRNGAAVDKASRMRLSLTAVEVDWLLEVLNDVRVGAWVSLGRPLPDRPAPVKPNSKALADHAAMEMAGLFQSILLAALHD